MPVMRMEPLFSDTNSKKRMKCKIRKNRDESIFSHRPDSSSEASHSPVIAIPVKPATEYQDWHPDRCETQAKATKPSKPTPPGIGDDEKRFLKTVIDNPEKPSMLYAKLAKMYAQKAITVRRWLVKNGYLHEERLNVNKRGRASIMLIPTEQAYRLFADESGEAS